LAQAAGFYALDDDGFYERIELRDGVFRSTVLYGSGSHEGTRQQTLEDDEFIRALVEAMLKEG
jgi:hypothetical protein